MIKLLHRCLRSRHTFLQHKSRPKKSTFVRLVLKASPAVIEGVISKSDYASITELSKNVSSIITIRNNYRGIVSRCLQAGIQTVCVGTCANDI